MNELPGYVVNGRVLYCGEPNWAYIGKDTDSGKPVLRNTITGSFIAADEYKITKPFDHENELLCDIEMQFNKLSDGITFPFLSIELTEASIGLRDIGYDDGTNNSGYMIFTTMIECQQQLGRLGVYIRRSDFEISLAESLYKLGLRKE